MPKLTIDLEAITTHLDALADTDLCPHCDAAVDALTGDVVQLLTEINRLYHALRDARILAANLLAAIRAALHAHADGEPDPLAYLRDELAGHHEIGTAGWCR